MTLPSKETLYYWITQWVNANVVILGVLVAGGDKIWPDYISPDWKHGIVQTVAFAAVLFGAANTYLQNTKK